MRWSPGPLGRSAYATTLATGAEPLKGSSLLQRGPVPVGVGADNSIALDFFKPRLSGQPLRELGKALLGIAGHGPVDQGIGPRSHGP